MVESEADMRRDEEMEVPGKKNLVLASLVPAEGEGSMTPPPTKKRRRYYVPVSEKKSGGARHKGVSKNKTEAEA